MYTLTFPSQNPKGILFRYLRNARERAREISRETGENVSLYRIRNAGGLDLRETVTPESARVYASRRRAVFCRDCGARNPAFLSPCPAFGDVHSKPETR